MRWSRLRSLLKEIFDPSVDLDIHCAVERGASGKNIGRYRVTLEGETIWDEPRDVAAMRSRGESNADASVMTNIMRAYLEVGREDLLTWRSLEDQWGVVELLRACDRRVGKRRLPELRERTYSPAALRVIAARLGEPPPQNSSSRRGV